MKFMLACLLIIAVSPASAGGNDLDAWCTKKAHANAGKCPENDAYAGIACALLHGLMQEQCTEIGHWPSNDEFWPWYERRKKQ